MNDVVGGSIGTGIAAEWCKIENTSLRSEFAEFADFLVSVTAASQLFP